MIDAWRSLSLPWEMESILASAPKVALAQTREEILAMALGGQAEGTYDVAYDVPGLGMYTEATVAKCANGLAVNYPEPYMRRRDPDCLVVADEMPTDKPKYKNLYGEPFFPLRQEVFEWLKNQPLLVLPFWAGGESLNCPALLIGPCNAAFFAGGLADLQGFIPASELPAHFAPKAVVYLAPPFRHTHFSKKQVVVHNRTTEMHEIFSFNLYPGPSAKKGIYGALIHIGEMEGWLTLHGSTVKVVTPYDNSLVILHEGASGSGKSEMIEQMHLEPDGRILLAQNTISGEKMHLSINETCELLPVTDDMALCQESFQNGGRRLVVKDAEAGWFLRVNHITHYGTDPQHESLCVHPKEPLIFLNMKGVPDSTCLIWEHIMDAPGSRAPIRVSLCQGTMFRVSSTSRWKSTCGALVCARRLAQARILPTASLA